MNNSRVEWHGLDEFLRKFGAIPQELNTDGMVIVREETEGAAAELVQSLPRVTGNLAKGVRTQFPSSTILVGLLLNASPHSHLWHWGTKGKKRYTAQGWNRGVMPAAKPEPMVPIVRRRRGRMARRLVDLLRSKGFEVGSV